MLHDCKAPSESKFIFPVTDGVKIINIFWSLILPQGEMHVIDPRWPLPSFRT
ncbi:hypothetical protein WM41_2270 [Corynebacterium simulans]|uniref:Uncharacterized protein n=1 Tax=Corynebacterium simulans TaxID=146827 RepID=A0ABR5V6A1_9CORY|nr:hypothetical protein WM41_2270 [Corynebacterium simulans]